MVADHAAFYTQVFARHLKLLLAMMFAAMPSCAAANDLQDLQFSAVSVVDRFDLVELPPSSVAPLYELLGQKGLAESGLANEATGAHRPMLKAEFTSTVDLASYASRRRAVNIANESYFCGRHNDYVVLVYPGVYWHGVRIAPDTKLAIPETTSEGERRYTYYVFLEVARKDSPGSKPPEIGFDLRIRAEDVCFYLLGGNEFRGRTYKSNVVKIPAPAIGRLFRKGN